MAVACTLSKEGLLDCGSSRGRTERVFLYECGDDVTTHLKVVFCRVQTWKNTRSSYKGLASTVCLMKKRKHYVFVLAIAMAWASTGGLQSCVSIQGTKDHQPASKVVTWFNPAMAKEVLQLFDISVPTGSRKNKTHNFWRISVLALQSN